MPQLSVPTAIAGYAEEEEVLVECSGKSTTTGGGWSLGHIACRSAGSEACNWVTKYLNAIDPAGTGDKATTAPSKRRSGKVEETRFGLARSLETGLSLESYPEIFPVITKSKTDPSYKERFAGNSKRFQDFAPFLVASLSSARFLAERAKVDTYPIRSFRASIIVDGVEPWAEESWSQLEVGPASGGSDGPIVMRKIKECPRCTVPCRNPDTGDFLFSEKLKLWNVLKAIYPRKNSDPEWGSWAGVFFGVYFGHAAQPGVVRVGDVITPTKVEPWDLHLQQGVLATALAKLNWEVLAGLLVLLIAAAVVLFL